MEQLEKLPIFSLLAGGWWRWSSVISSIELPGTTSEVRYEVISGGAGDHRPQERRDSKYNPRDERSCVLWPLPCSVSALRIQHRPGPACWSEQQFHSPVLIKKYFPLNTKYFTLKT